MDDQGRPSHSLQLRQLDGRLKLARKLMDPIRCDEVMDAREQDREDDQDRLKELVVVHGILHAVFGNIAIDKDEDNPVEKKEKPSAKK